MIAVVRRFEGGPVAAAQVLGMQWSGGEGVGPCPACGGRDRCHVRAHRNGDGRILVGCRQCDDRDALGAALDETLGAEPPDPRRVLARAPTRQSHPRSSGPALPPRRIRTPPALSGRPSGPSEESRRRSAARGGREVPATSPVAAIWSAAVAPEGSPARLYLRERRVWPPEGPGFPILPPSVRWLPRGHTPAIKGGLRPLPPGAAGAILYRFEDAGGELRALQAEALAHDGRRLPWPGRYPDPDPPQRISVGSLRGAGFPARDADGGRCVIVEGPADALAVVLLLIGPDAPAVIAAGGSGGFVALALREAARRETVILLSDDDDPGRRDARKAAHELRRAKFRLPERRSYAGGDPAEALEHEIREREAIRDPGGDDLDGALRGAWTDLLRQEGNP